MLSAEENDRLTQVGPGTPMGKLMRRYWHPVATSQDIKESPVLIVPMEEPLLQREVIDRLLPRLAVRFPERERDLVMAYHDLVQGVDSNTIFGNAFKALEEIARGITNNQNLELNREDKIKKHFPHLHPLIFKTITHLANQRGDEGGHGRLGPDVHEIRYLLFQICNIALLFLDYPNPQGEE